MPCRGQWRPAQPALALLAVHSADSAACPADNLCLALGTCSSGLPTPTTWPAAPLQPPLGSDFERIDSELRAYDEKREQVIKRSRDIQKLSKQVRAAGGAGWLRATCGPAGHGPAPICAPRRRLALWCPPPLRPLLLPLRPSGHLLAAPRRRC